jgi:hypothetical protein
LALRSLESLRTEEAILGSQGSLSLLRESSLVVADLGKLHLLALSAQQVGHVQELLTTVGSFVGRIALRDAIVITLTEKLVTLDGSALVVCTVVVHSPDRQ